jgi:Flp pilus assembly pilin Flp
MTNVLRTLRKDDRGQAIVELALVLPVILLLIVGILEFARAWNLHQVMTDAVREGARRAAIANTWPVDSVKAPMWRALVQFGYNPDASHGNAYMDVSPVGNYKISGSNVTVTLALPYKIWVLGNRSFTMRSSLTVRNE